MNIGFYVGGGVCGCFYVFQHFDPERPREPEELPFKARVAHNPDRAWTLFLPAQLETVRELDSAGTQTGQTRIVSCDRLVSTTIYAIWGLPINELYTSGPCRPLIRYPSEANLSVIFRSKVE